ncbi:hypothetical protein ABT369_01160 [Dactylosporangium sp. NPDC000244]|uniref:hypothetical protein n=1 Tax=Dactylosporangium sp. NPDC000244 TaxID=3154365 RepID=UPI0033328159
MSMLETLGVLAHRGGLIVEHPELTVGVVRAISRPTGLELELLARRPLDHRDVLRRQADIRAGRTGPPPAPRRLLPAFDEGIDLRVGWLDDTGRAHWEFGSWESSSDYDGFRLRTRLQFPPRYSHVPVALAWPEIGFPETVVDLALPDRVTVERGTVSIWDAPLDTAIPPSPLHYRADETMLGEPRVEAGRIVAEPRVLHRGDDAAVVLTRLTAVAGVLSLEIVSIAHGERARAATAADFPPREAHLETGASIATLDGHAATRVRPYAASSSGGATAFQSRAEFAVPAPAGDTLTLLVAWPAAGLSDAVAAVAVHAA